MSDVKGSNLSVGELVSLQICNTDKVNTVIVGPITGIQEWSSNQIAVQVAGVQTWIVLNDKVELGAV